MRARLFPLVLGALLALLLPFAASADPRDALVGEWEARGPDGAVVLVMVLAEDGTLTMSFDGEVETVGSWDVVDGKLQLTDEERPENNLVCDYVVAEPSLTISGAGDCAQAPPFTRRS